ncbi:hypothetical protein [Paracraurococcus ruber]|uniref:hypothetical protein n=1 Tax=Paracraurococcus ruber TaxID=77675 RepID=UPI0013054592|nr:hypothetical protein [Paracraurococcus ruber]TDG33743.1 hypothetical protein E2C05_02695 [Paracraurococcus ruber]
MRRPLWLMASLLLAPAAWAQSAPPACGAAREGITACIGEKLCECRYERGGSVSGRREGFHWDCGILRPSCGVAPAGPGSQMPPMNITPFIQPNSGQSGYPSGSQGYDPRQLPPGTMPYGFR